MNLSNVHKKKTKLLLFFCLFSTQISAISSNMSDRVMSTSPLLYRMIDYSKQQNCFEVAPIFSSMYDTHHTIANLTPFGKQTLQFSQQGTGDLNPVWLNLMSNNDAANYNSSVTFTPSLTKSGALFHWYDQFDGMFVEVKTALVQCKSEIKISEQGGGNGLNTDIRNAQQAFTQPSWNYGKIGQANHVVGLDDVELRLGGIYKATSLASTYDLLISGFAIVQAPTGSGTQAEWLFEPQVGTNHWGLGFGFETLVSGDDDLKFMLAGNYRYLVPAWETRSFDLINCGPWSRYLGIQETFSLPNGPLALSLPGINYLTQQAYINGRSQLNIYARLQKQFKSSYFELSYNFLCTQQETIGAIKNINTGYGIYALTGPAGGDGGVTTSSNATINQNLTTLDPIGLPEIITTAHFNKQSACAQTYASNNVTARLEIKNNNVIYGFGASIDAALSASAISTWSVWAQFGLLFGKKEDIEEPYKDIHNETFTTIHQPLNVTDNESENIKNDIDIVDSPVDEIVADVKIVEDPVIEIMTLDPIEKLLLTDENNPYDADDTDEIDAMIELPFFIDIDDGQSEEMADLELEEDDEEFAQTSYHDNLEYQKA